jgi:hypothetical protein
MGRQLGIASQIVNLVNSDSRAAPNPRYIMGSQLSRLAGSPMLHLHTNVRQRYANSGWFQSGLS